MLDDSTPHRFFLDSIVSDLRTQKNLVLSASPGAGKTTRLPPRLLELTDKKILVLEPRRIAAVGAAARIAEEQGWTLGKQIGYQIRFDAKFEESTRLIFLTEALLNRKLLADPELKDVGIVVLDEFHERSQHVDLALGCLKELQELSRPDLKIVVMSATLMAEPIVSFLGEAASIVVPGQSHPLEIIYQKTAQKLQTDHHFIDAVTSQIRQVTASLKPGEHVLVFLPGVGEIERCFSQLETWAQDPQQKKEISLQRLHGTLSLEEQRAVLKPYSGCKVILATNVAESSITIDGVRAVIDSGLQRRSSVSPKTGFPQLEVARISKSSATQRSGRAARQAAGRSFRLWSTMDELSMPTQEVAEILRVDLSEALLFLARMGVSNFSQFSWFEKPSPEQIQKAERHLKNIGALNLQNQLTELGQQILRYPVPPRLGKLLVTAQEMGIPALGADLASLLLERDLLRTQSVDSDLECDLSLRLELLHTARMGRRPSEISSSSFQQIDRASQQLRKLMGKDPSSNFSLEPVRELLLKTFADQLCRRRKAKAPRGIMIGGRGVSLDTKSQVRDSEFFIALQLIEGLSSSETRVSLACGLSKSEALHTPDMKVQNQSWIEFDSESEKIMRFDAKSLVSAQFGSLPIEETQARPASAKEAEEHLPEVAFSARLQIFEKNESLRNWLERFHFLQKLESIDEISDEIWKAVFQEASYGENALAALYSKDLIYFLQMKLPAELFQKIQTGCPDTITVPSGSHIRVNYAGAHPALEVRLQEVFGWKETPRILQGSVPLTLVLLGPNYRPVQVTQDLQSFWSNGYPEVRKELRTRYPKHSWPEDPRTAMAVAKGRPRK